ncbi:MAG TPA: FHA domain-containing protein [Frankiaceae bacterium]|nr:FHA domain-containing protein [Frankiaceae bacterium]
MDRPYLRIEDSGRVHELAGDVTTVGRGAGVDLALEDPTVSRLHAEFVARGPHVYVSDLGLSTNGTRVNGRPVGRRILTDGDVISFGMARLRIGGLTMTDSSDADTVELRRVAAPDLTRRELEVLACLCRPALTQEAFVAPGTAREIADELVVTEAAVKQHLLRLYAKFSIPEGINRRARLANEVVRAGVIRPLPGVPELDAQQNRANSKPPESRRPSSSSSPAPALPGSMTSGRRAG